VLCHEHFRRKLPQKSLVCIFDNEERSKFTNTPSLGKNFRGFTIPICEPKFQTEVRSWPPDILKCVLDGNKFLCDITIYLRNQTCESQTGTVITFAHEVQHFTQYGGHRKVWLANRHLKDGRLFQGRLPPWHFPDEYEALLVSKRVAETVIGRDEIRVYAEQERDRELVECKGDLKKWEFFLCLDVDEEFDLLKRTTSLVNERREYLGEYFPACSSDDPDYSKEEWWR
jgi:hypothetical protein